MTSGLKGTPAVTETIHNTIDSEKHKQTYGEITDIAIQCSSAPMQVRWPAETVINTLIILLYVMNLHNNAQHYY